jgi:very-short-patch-repair endonuclease
MRHPSDADAIQGGLDAMIARLAERQHGVIARHQVRDLGATRGFITHRVRTRRWELLSPGVFRVGGSPASWHQALTAAALAWGAGAAVSHRAAGAIWTLPGFRPGTVELTIPRTRQRVGPGITHRGPLARTDVTMLGALPVTRPARTIIDLASVCPYDELEEAVDDALTRKLVTLDLLKRRLQSIARRGRPGVRAMRRLLDARDAATAPPESVMERKLLRLMREGGLPTPSTQYEIWDEGRLIARCDFAYPTIRLAIEADGFAYHAKRDRWHRDRARDARLVALGWRVIRFTWRDISERPGWVAATIKAAR